MCYVYIAVMTNEEKLFLSFMWWKTTCHLVRFSISSVQACLMSVFILWLGEKRIQQPATSENSDVENKKVGGVSNLHLCTLFRTLLAKASKPTPRIKEFLYSLSLSACSTGPLSCCLLCRFSASHSTLESDESALFKCKLISVVRRVNKQQMCQFNHVLLACSSPKVLSVWETFCQRSFLLFSSLQPCRLVTHYRSQIL